ncbi:TIGR00725 family protein [Phormidium tenue FACHB-886]|nr:TIGR00725 family protein [Phormidium tenue FACHB-886]
MPKIIAGVMGAGETATDADRQTAYALGQQIAQQGWVLLTGGRNQGVMDAASRGAKQANGLTVGILPRDDRSAEIVSEAIDIAIFTDLGNARNNVNVLSSTIIFACGGGAGTVSEIALALKAKKQVILLNADATSLAFFQQLAPAQIRAAATVEEAIALAQKSCESL